MGIWTGTASAPKRWRISSMAPLEVGADAVHLVDEGDARHAVAVGLAPDRLGLRLTPPTAQNTTTAPSSTRSERSTSTVKSTWPGRVNDVDLVLAPEAGGGGGGDGDAALLLLGHPVHRGGALVHLAHPVELAGVEEDALGGGGLAGVNVGGDADIAGLV